MENTATGVGYFDDMDITTYDPIFDEKDITAVEQRLVLVLARKSVRKCALCR